MNSSKRTPGALRVIGGKYRSRLLRVPQRPGLRPTPDRVRETLFNWLGQDLSGLACLDLFAGSGALGFEAASRGATRVVLVEKDRAAVAELERNRAALDATQVTIVHGDAAAYLAREHERLDARPPSASTWYSSIHRSGRMRSRGYLEISRRGSSRVRACMSNRRRRWIWPRRGRNSSAPGPGR